MKWIKRSGVILGACIALALGITSGASAQNDHTFAGPGKAKNSITGTNSTLKKVRAYDDRRLPFMPNEFEDPSIVTPQAPENFLPPGAKQLSMGGGIGTESLPGVLQSYAGIGYTNWIPPDPEIAAGPYNTVSVVNSSFAIHDRNGTQGYINTFATFMGAPTWTFFDPKVAYDAWNNRFVILVLAMQQDANNFVTNENYVLLYSDDNNAYGNWSWRWLDAKYNGGTYVNDHWVDYPYLGITSGGIAVSGIKFPQGSGSGSYSHLRFLRSAEIYGAGGVNWYDFAGFTSNGSNDYRLVPARQLWQNGNFYVVNTKEGGSNTVTIRRFTNFTWPTGVPTYDTTVKTVNSYAVAPAATQKGESRKLEVIDCRTLAVTFSNQKLFVTHQSAANFGTGLRGCTKWYRFNVGLGTEVDETIGFTNFDCYYPAIASNLNGDASLSMAYSGATEYASIIHAGCKISETGVGGAQYIIGGLAGYFEDYGQGRNRWGDYFGSSVDWWDGLSFYGVGQYAKTTNQWQCQIWRSNYKPSYVFSVAAASGQLTGTTTLSATLTRSDTSAPLAGYSVPFSISGTYVGSGTTNASGVATFVYAIPFQVPTTRTISCSLDEDGTFNAGSGSAVLTIQKANTAVYIYNSSPVAGSTQPLYQYMYRTTDNTYVNGESLEFWVDGAYRGNATMVSNLATFNFAVPIAWQGVKSMWGYYPGNTYYNASVDYGGTMTVYRPTQHNRWDAEARRTESGTMWVQYLDYNGVPIVNGDVNFYYDGVWDGVTRHTDSSGYAYRTYTVGAAETIGAHTWDALMYPPAASPYYQTQHAVGTFTVKGPSFIGQTTLSDWYWYYYLNRNVRIKIKNSANVVVVNTVVNAPYGNWEVPYSGPTGTYKVFIEPSHWLSQYVGSVAFTSTTYGSAWQYTTHENGDCNGDNIIDLTDYTQVVVAFNGIYGSAPYTDPADLNGDGVVDLTDYTVIITNFNHIGQQYGF